LASPQTPAAAPTAAPVETNAAQRHALSPAVEGLGDGLPMLNEPARDFAQAGLSGVGSKVGGPDYLLHFVEPRSVTENTMRRGFAPGLE